MWVLLVVAVTWLVKALTFIFHILLGLAVLIWFTVYTILAFFYNCIYNILYIFGARVNEALVLFCKPFAAAGAFLGRLGTIILTVLQLSLRALYHIVVLWLLVYMLNFIYHFVQHRDFTLHREFFLVPAPTMTILARANKN